jgi:hypothetical protein
MVSPEVIPLVKEWRVHEDGTSSDHRILETRFDFEKKRSPPQLQEKSPDKSLRRGHSKAKMAQPVRTMVDGGAYASKEKHLQGKKEIPGGKDPPTREQEKIRHWETRKEYAKTVTKAEIQSWQDFVTEKVHRPVDVRQKHP